MEERDWGARMKGGANCVRVCWGGGGGGGGRERGMCV